MMGAIENIVFITNGRQEQGGFPDFYLFAPENGGFVSVYKHGLRFSSKFSKAQF